MEKEIIFKEDFAEGFYYPEYKMSQITWKRVVSSEEYRNAFTKTIDFTIDRDLFLYLTDARLQGVVSPEDRKWFQNVIVPRGVKQGLKYGAVVIKKEPFKKYYMNAILRLLKRKTKISMRIFYDYDTAFKWITAFVKNNQ